MENKPGRILCIDTSGDRCAVALGNGAAGIEAMAVLNRPNAHSEVLAPLTRQVLDNASRSMDDLDALALVTGPGSFTGLRIGMSFVKGIAYGLDIPVIGITAFEAIAGKYAEFTPAGGKVTVMLDARRGELYCQTFRKAENGNHIPGLVPESEPEILTVSRLQEQLSGENTAVCYGAEKFIAELRQKLDIPVYAGYPCPATVFRIALKRMREGQTDDLDTLVPMYMRSFAGVL